MWNLWMDTTRGSGRGKQEGLGSGEVRKVERSGKCLNRVLGVEGGASQVVLK